MRMKQSFFIFTLWLGLLLTSNTQAHPHHPWIIKNAPATYIVREGDTLWDVSAKFLHDPYRWPQVWKTNPEIENPNLIYPGDTIVLYFVSGKPCLKVQRKDKVRILPGSTVKLYPKVQKFPANRAIPTIPLSVIGPFFNDSRVVTPYQATHCPPIIALDEDHLVVGTGDYIYVSGIPPTVPERIFSIFRPGKIYIDPLTSEPLGTEALVLGKAQVRVLGEPSRLSILQCNAEARIGDRLIQTEKEAIDPYFVPKLPVNEADGQIISVFGGINQIGQYQVVVVTGGKDIQREIGDVLVISQINKDMPSRFTAENDEDPRDFPPLAIGTCLIFRVFDKVSYGLIVKATRAIYLLDAVSSP